MTTINDLRKRGVTHLNDAKEFAECCIREVTRREVDCDKLGKMMRRLRQDSGKSLREVARQMGISAPYLSDCELGQRYLGLAYLQLFINICGEKK